jgi:hypothetical protein
VVGVGDALVVIDVEDVLVVVVVDTGALMLDAGGILETTENEACVDHKSSRKHSPLADPKVCNNY